MLPASYFVLGAVLDHPIIRLMGALALFLHTTLVLETSLGLHNTVGLHSTLVYTLIYCGFIMSLYTCLCWPRYFFALSAAPLIPLGHPPLYNRSECISIWTRRKTTPSRAGRCAPFFEEPRLPCIAGYQDAFDILPSSSVLLQKHALMQLPVPLFPGGLSLCWVHLSFHRTSCHGLEMFR